MGKTVEIALPRLHPGQVEVRGQARRFNVLCAGRRWGKNILAEDLVSDTVAEKAPLGWFSPYNKTLADDWRRTKDTFAGIIDGVTLTAKITPLGSNSFEFKAEGIGVELTGTVNPVKVGLILGNDQGSAEVTAAIIIE